MMVGLVGQIFFDTSKYSREITHRERNITYALLLTQGVWEVVDIYTYNVQWTDCREKGKKISGFSAKSTG